MPFEQTNEALHREAEKLSVSQTTALLSVVVLDYGLCIWWLLVLPLTDFERTACAFAAVSFGYGVSGRPIWSLIHAVTKMPAHRCIYYGTFAGHALGAIAGAAAGAYFAK